MAKKRARTATSSRAARQKLPLRTQVQHDIDKALAQAGIPCAIDSHTVWSVVAHNVGDIGADDVPNCIFDCLWLAQATAEGLRGKKKAAKKR